MTLVPPPRLTGGLTNVMCMVLVNPYVMRSYVGRIQSHAAGATGAALVGYEGARRPKLTDASLCVSEVLARKKRLT